MQGRGEVVTKIGALEAVRQVGLGRRRGQHDAAARQGVDPVGERERLLDQLFDQQHRGAGLA